MGDDGKGMVDIAVEAPKNRRDEVVVNEALDSRLHGFLALGLDPAKWSRRLLCPTRTEPPSFVRAEVLLPELRQLHHTDYLARRVELGLYLSDRFRSLDSTL